MSSPGWYADPWGRAELRWWDGVAWTSHVAAAGTAVCASDQEDRAVSTLPFSGVGVAAAGFVVGVLLSGVFGLVAVVVTGSIESTAVTVAGLFGLWCGLLGACLLASRRLGTGNLRADLGLGFGWFDLLRGLGTNIVGRVATIIVAIPLLALGLTSTNTKILQTHKGSGVSIVVLGLAIVIGAPIVEELFFRGVLLRSLASRFTWGRSVAIQAVAFGLAHANPRAGWRTFGLVAITATFGVTQGVFTRRWSTLGPLMVSHALFNLVPVVIIAFK